MMMMMMMMIVHKCHNQVSYNVLSKDSEDIPEVILGH